MTDTELLSLAAGVESGSSHPIARAVLDAARERAIGVPVVTEVTVLAGRGVSARQGSRELVLGNDRLMAALGVDVASLAAEAREHEAQGRSVAWVAERVTGVARLLGLLAFGDPPRPVAAEAVAALHALGLRTVMVSGDNRR